MYNKVTLIGNLGKDPETVSIKNGESKLTKFTVATKPSKNAETEWFNVVAFDKLGELVSEYLHKGSLVYIEGSFKSNTWEDDDNVKRTSYSVTAYTVKFLSPKDSGDSGASNSNVSSYKRGPSHGDNYDGDIPF